MSFDGHWSNMLLNNRSCYVFLYVMSYWQFYWTINKNLVDLFLNNIHIFDFLDGFWHWNIFVLDHGHGYVSYDISYFFDWNGHGLIYMNINWNWVLAYNFANNFVWHGHLNIDWNWVLANLLNNYRHRLNHGHMQRHWLNNFLVKMVRHVRSVQCVVSWFVTIA